MRAVRDLVVVLGDQLDAKSAAFDDFDAKRDLVFLCEAPAEAEYAWSHKARIAVFLSAMRHFAAKLRDGGVEVRYLATGEHAHDTIADALAAEIADRKPDRVVVVEPGEWRLREAITKTVRDAGVELDLRDDRHFLCTTADFARWLEGRRQPRMEHFYHWMRRRHDVLMRNGKPERGRWNFDSENRKPFGREGPGHVPPPLRFEPDAITREVLRLVAERYADHPGSLDAFDWPLTREDALAALEDFVEHRLAAFGPFQDAMWTGEPLLHHSRLSAALNLKLLRPREVIDAAIAAFRRREAPIESVEGFVRQILGWREYVRGLYWAHMPDYLDDNALGADAPLPGFYWTGDTDMACLSATIGDTLAHGYAHHIQRLMVTGLFALLLGVRPREVHGWYLAVYVDAVEWVELPNTIGMSQFADGGLMGSKPYVASGRYIERMSNYCADCRYRPGAPEGERACPFTVLYWDFLARHEQRFGEHPRLKLQVANLRRKSDEERRAIGDAASALRKRLAPTKS